VEGVQYFWSRAHLVRTAHQARKGHNRSRGTQAQASKERVHSPRRVHFPRNSKAKIKKELAIVPGSFVIFPCCYFILRSP
jgi:hypothetical protein